MEFMTGMGVLAISFPLGMLHALDPDHVLAVAALTGRESTPTRALSYALNWAIGHGGLLLLITAAVLGFHFVLPPDIPYWAERSVGIILIVTGTSVFLNIRKECLHGHEHVHMHADDNTPHSHAASVLPQHSTLRAPILIGIVHGTAGSAPFLALLPAAFLSPARGLLYVVIFSGGVLAGMLSFALVLRLGQGWLDRKARALGFACRQTIAIAAVGAGMYWLIG